jgi:hypothetical protein
MAFPNVAIYTTSYTGTVLDIPSDIGIADPVRTPIFVRTLQYLEYHGPHMILSLRLDTTFRVSGGLNERDDLFEKVEHCAI